MKRIICPASLLALLLLTSVPSSNLSAQESPDPLRVALARRIDDAKIGTGVVVGLLTPEGRSFAVYGRASAEGTDVTADTVFEIGSVTKVFTSFLLADMVERGEVKLNDPVQKYLPASVKVPSRRGKQILLVDLATHSSGLPRDSVPVDLESDQNPYETYSASELYAFLGSYRLESDPGSKIEYSNVGFGLLGHALELRAGMSYEELLRRRILEPVGMTSTAITLTAEQRSRRATGHNPKRVPVAHWTGVVIVPTGGINSTATDMLKFAAALLDPKNPMSKVFARMMSVKRQIDSRSQQGLGWGIFRLGGNDLVGHSGGTFGFETRFVVDTTRKRAVIAWINAGRGEGVSDLAGLALNRARLD